MANTKLPARLLDTSAVPALNVTGDLTVDTTTLKVDSTNNRVGIGIAAPDFKLDVLTASADGIRTNSASQTIIRLDTTNTNAAARNWQMAISSVAHGDFNLTTSTTLGGDPANATSRLYINASGNVGIGTTSPNALLHIKTADPATNQAVIDFRNPTYGIFAQTNSISSRGNTLEFIASDYNSNSATTHNVLTMRPEGKVGIGTTSPDALLEVSNITDNDLPLFISGGTASLSSLPDSTGIAFGYGSAAGYKKGAIIWEFTQTNAIGKLHLCNDGAADANNVQLSDSKMTIDSSGNVGIGNQNPGYPLDVTSNSSALGIRIRGRSDHIGELNFSSNNGATIYSQIQSLASELRVKAISNIPMKFYTNNNQRMTLDTNGDVTLSNGSVSTAIDQFQNNGITSTTSAGASWTLTTNSGTFNTRGSLEVAGISNRHVFKWGFSGNLSANTWYPFAKRSELATYGPDSGGTSEDGFAMYFRIYSYTSTSGWGEYLANRLTNMVWIGNYGSNSTQEHEFVVGPGLGHAPNGGQSVDTASSNPIRMRIHHRMGSGDNPNSDQTFEILVASALTGLNATVAGRQLLIYGYVL